MAGMWKKWVKPAFIVFYVLGLIIGLPFAFLSIKNEALSSMRFAYFIGGFFVLGAISISLWTILEHLISYTKPYLQRNIIRILWMVPIYATNAWFALRFPETAIYFDTLRECYEAYAIYNFLAFLLNYLRREYLQLGEHLEEKEQVNHLPPLCCIKSWKMGEICEVNHVYEETNFSYKYAYIYLTVINNISQIWALYCLVLFYQCTKTELKPMNPVAKFICVKFVVFMSFWQSVLISILVASGVIQKVEGWELHGVQRIGIALQNFAICIEMFIAAIGHHFAFSVTPYRDTSIPRSSCCTSWWSMLDVSDMKRDVVQHVRHVGSSVGFIGSEGRFSGLPRSVIVPGLSKSRALNGTFRNGRRLDDEFRHLIPSSGINEEDAIDDVPHITWHQDIRRYVTSLGRRWLWYPNPRIASDCVAANNGGKEDEEDSDTSFHIDNGCIITVPPIACQRLLQIPIDDDSVNGNFTRTDC